ncbi:hypothetical protein ACJX0J_020813, partial [Zea mays]
RQGLRRKIRRSTKETVLLVLWRKQGPYHQDVPYYNPEAKGNSRSCISTSSAEAEAIEAWRVGKLKDMRSTSSKNLSNFGLSRMLKRALEFNWQMLLEDIGLWIPPTIYHIEHDDKPENEPEEIIPGPPLPPECNTELHTDYGGTAVRWGLTHHKESVADCCQACIDQAKMARPGALKCNIWVYCPSEYGCYSPDKYEHKHQECWLKQ